MCGIAGALSFSQSDFRLTEEYLLRMRDSMVHRGPDGSGVWLAKDKKIGLAHRRLAIIDLSEAANQPMSNSDNTIWIVFNGEIYNHSDIRAELNELGKYKCKTQYSDTEVIIHAYEEWGIDCVSKFQGMFSIALWDSTKKELFLIRDRVGVKPLYYSIHNQRVVFASEIKALLEDSQQKREVNEESFFHYLSFLTVPAPNTLFSGIFKLPAGSWIKFNEIGGFVEHRYWDALDHVYDSSGLSEDQVAEMVLGELKRSIKLRMVSDVPVGVFLSGGIDSSANAVLNSECSLGPIDTFSIGYEGSYKSYQNELLYAKKVAVQINARYHEKLLSAQDLIEFLPIMATLQDEPLADPVCVPVYYVSKLARDSGVIVCQVGEGADELFCGYPHWKFMLSLQKSLDLLRPLLPINILLKFFKAFGKGDRWYCEYLDRFRRQLPIFWGAEVFNDVQKKNLLSSRMLRKYGDLNSWSAIESIWVKFIKKTPRVDSLQWMTYLDLNFRLPELLLMRVDKMSMGASIEVREPFLDHKLIELALGIPQDIKIKNGVLKSILKKSLRGLLPDEILDRKKQGFAAPIDEWMGDELGDLAWLKLKDFCIQSDLLNWEAVEKLLKSNKRANAWPLLNVAQWWEIYIKPGKNYGN
jgi:asparagine synthase (glutamine-hydrolysing)